MVEPTVFPPFLTFSTRLLLEFIETLPLKDKTLLELGCGCGIISVLAAKRNALVTASDINTIALEALKKNAVANHVSLDIRYSDLFERLQGRTFDIIIINPPYYPRTPKSVAESAWFCGENFDYFEKLFSALPNYMSSENGVFMILSEDCDLTAIKAIALRNAIAFEKVVEKKAVTERNFIFRLTSL